MIDPLNTGAIAFHILLAGLLTLVAGIVLLVLYRRAVRRWMLASDRPGVTTAAAAPPPLSPPTSPLAIELIDPGTAFAGYRMQSPAMRGAAAAFRRAALVHALAGVVHAAVATALQIAFGMFDFAPVRAGAVLCANAWPVVLTLALFWGPDRRRQLATVAAYLAVLALIAVVVELGETPPLPLATLPGIADPVPGTEAAAARLQELTLPPFAQPLLVWVLFALPTVYLLLFLNRRVRAIGPALLLPMLVAAAGVHLAVVIVLSGDRGLRIFMAVTHITGIGAGAWFYGVQLAGLLVFMLPGWFVLSWLARRYDRKATSDQALVFDAIWLFATLLLCQSLIREAGPIGWTGLLAFVAYKLVTRIGLAPLAAQAGDRPPVRLLVLRVFGFQRRTERFFAVLSARWRYAGSIQLIAASDLASATIEPGEFLGFLSGRLRRLFIHDRADLERRLSQMDIRPDPDGRFRVNEFFCTDDTWRDAATRLMGSSDFVIMDLRGFSPANKGCIYELQALVDGVALARLVLLVDRSTDVAFLEATLAGCWRRLGPTSPNRSGVTPRPRLLQTKGGGAPARALLALADAALASAGR